MPAKLTEQNNVRKNEMPRVGIESTRQPHWRELNISSI